MEKISIIIVNWNTGKLLARCVQSLLQLSEQEVLGRIIIIDNASTDDSMNQAQQSTGDNPNVSFVRSGENLGFALANNVGIKRLGKDSSDHVLLLNPDTEMKPGSLAALRDALERNPKAGIIGPALLNPDGTHQPSVRRFPNLTVLAALFLKLHRLLPNDPAWRTYLAADFDYSRQQVVEQVMGACFLIRRQALREVGLLDDRFWVWFEEVDFCRRAAAKGWQTLYTPGGSVVHHGGASFHQLVGWRKTMPFLASALRYARKHFSLPAAAALYALIPIAALLALPAALPHAVQRVKNTTRL